MRIGRNDLIRQPRAAGDVVGLVRGSEVEDARKEVEQEEPHDCDREEAAKASPPCAQTLQWNSSRTRSDRSPAHPHWQRLTGSAHDSLLWQSLSGPSRGSIDRLSVRDERCVE